MAPATLSALRNAKVVVADDGKGMGLWLTNADGSAFETGLDENGLNQLLGTLLNAVQDLATKTSPPPGETREITATPIPAARLGVARGRSDTEAFLAVQMGPVSLTFALELKVLAGMCESLQAVAQQGPPRSAH